jgi:hypothetical protein
MCLSVNFMVVSLENDSPCFAAFTTRFLGMANWSSVHYRELGSAVVHFVDGGRINACRFRCLRAGLGVAVTVGLKFAAVVRAFAAKLLQRQLEPSLLDSQGTKIPAVECTVTTTAFVQTIGDVREM